MLLYAYRSGKDCRKKDKRVDPAVSDPTQEFWGSPPKIPEATIAGAKRDPSSLVQIEASIGVEEAFGKR